MGHILCSSQIMPFTPRSGLSWPRYLSQTTRTLTMYVPTQVQWVLTCAAPLPSAEITPASALELPLCWDTCARGARPAEPGPSTAFHTRRQPVGRGTHQFRLRWSRSV